MVIHLPALLLMKALAFVHPDVPDLQTAKGYLQGSMALAREQSALSYQLSAGLEHARIWIQGSEVQRARDLIRPIYGRFSKSFATPDLIRAREILDTA